MRRTELIESGALIEVAVEGLRGPRYVPSDALTTLDAAEAEVRDGVPPGRAEPGVAFLAPLDPFVWDRALLRDLFGFDYVWEVYVPQAKRRWGYYVLPILFGDRLVGRIEPRIERREGVLRVVGLWFEDGFEPLAEPAFVPAFAPPSAHTPTSAASSGSCCPGMHDTAPWSGRCRSCSGEVAGSAADRRQRSTVTYPICSSCRPCPGIGRGTPCQRPFGSSGPFSECSVVVRHVAPRHPRRAALDLEVAEPGGEDLQPAVGAGPSGS